MKKNLKKYLYIGAILPHIFFLIVGLAFAMVVTSLSDVYIESNDPIIGGQTWIASVILGQMSDEIIGEFEPTDFEFEGKTAEHGLRLNADIIKNTCNYRFINQYQKIVKYELVINNKHYWTKSSGISACDAIPSDGDRYIFYKGSIITGYWFWCFTADKVGDHGTLAFDSYIQEMKVSFTADGTMKEGYIDNFVNPSVTVGYGDRTAHADWIGNLVSGDQCEAPREQDVVSVHTDIGWRITDEGKWDDYKNFYATGFENCLIRWFEYGTETPTSCIDKINSKANYATSSKTFYSTKGNIASVSGDEAYITLFKPIMFPNLRIRIKAKWLGIYIPVGIPKIISATIDGFEEGSDKGYILVGVKNVGDATGSFALSASCLEYFGQDGTVGVFSLGADGTDTKTIHLSLRKDISEDTCETCTVKLVERNTGKFDTKDVEACASPIKICTEGQTRCENNKFYECKINQWVNIPTRDKECILICSSNADCPSEKPYCVSKTCVECRTTNDCEGSFECKDNFCVEIKECRALCDKEFGLFHPVSKEICYIKCEISDFFAKNKYYIIGGFVAVFAIIALLIISKFIPMKINRRRR